MSDAQQGFDGESLLNISLTSRNIFGLLKRDSSQNFFLRFTQGQALNRKLKILHFIQNDRR